MAKTEKSSAASSAPKKTRAPRKKPSETIAHQAHGAVNPTPTNMDELFGIKSVYTAKTITQYREQLDGYTVTDLHAHAHHVGVIPLDPREKLVSTLERKFLETQSRALPLKMVPTQANPAMLEAHRKFMQG